MKTTKKLLSLLLALVMVMTLCATAFAADDDEPLTLRICLSETQEDTKSGFVRDTVKAIEERTEGRVKFDIYYSDALGSIGEVMEQISLGGNIIGCTSGEQWAPYGTPDMTALNMLYVFPSAEAVENFNTSDVWEEMKEEASANGLTMICMNWASAPRVVMSTRPINSVADLDKLLLRVPSVTYASFFEKLGCATTTMTFSEIYTAMQSGIVEAAEAPMSTLYSYSLQEVAKYIYMSNHSFASACFGMATTFWDQISEEDQQIIIEEFNKNGKAFSDQAMAENDEWLAKMEEAGVTVTQPSEEDKAAMAEAATASFADFPELSDGLLERMQEAF